MKRILVISILFIGYISHSQTLTADFSGSPVEICLGEDINFTNLSTPGSFPITNYAWDFGDGNFSSLQNPNHIYSAAGTYSITLIINDSDGASDFEQKVGYIIVNPLPVVGFTVSGNGCTVPFAATFTNTSSSGAEFTYSWDFGNSQTSNLQNPAPVTYASTGTYNVSLTVTNTNTGCVNSFTDDIIINDFTAEFNFPSEACVGEIVSFTDMSTAGVNSWSWNFGDFQTSNQQNPSSVYGSPGTYTVTLTSQNTGIGCSDVVTHDILINPLPVPSFTADVQTGCSPLLVTFSSTSPGGVDYNWDFGNGNTFNGEIPPAETYIGEGNYDVTLSIEDANGCVGSLTMNDFITVAPPIADFTIDVDRGCDPLTVTFTDLSVSEDPTNDPIVNWQWDFGDGSPLDNSQNPTHIYTEGVYSVTLNITTQDGCTATITKVDTIQVGSHSIVDFIYAPPIECIKTDIAFTDLTTFVSGTPGPGEVIWTWDFDPGNSTDQNPTYQYTQPSDTGYHDVKLIVDWRGCKDSLIITDAIYINAPVSKFTPDQTLYCDPGHLGIVPVNVVVNDEAVIHLDADDVEMIWKWGDGTPNTLLDDIDLDGANGNANHDYANYGSYTIEQVIYNHTTGCSDSTTQTIHISWVDGDFALSNDSTCVGSPISLTSNSTTFAPHPFGTHSYNMGNGAFVSGTNPSYTYNTSGSYDITLISTNSVGCKDTVEFLGMDVLARPIASIIPSDIAGCAPITVTYSNNSSTTGNGVPLESFNWTLPDLSTVNTTDIATTVDYTYTTEGNFTVSMIATDEFGCVSPSTSVSMSVTKPVANFIITDTVNCDLEAFQFTNTSTGTPILTYEWYIDGTLDLTTEDFNPSFDETPSSSYNQVAHDIMLITTDGNGCKDTLDQTIHISLPYADFDTTMLLYTLNSQGQFSCPPITMWYNDNSSAYGGVNSWNWNFSNGQSTLDTAFWSYVYSGDYTTTLTIFDTYGCIDDTSITNFIQIFGPSADPSILSSDGCGQENNYNLVNLEDVDHFTWDMGDGTVFSDQTEFTYTYFEPGTYYTTLILYDQYNCDVPYYDTLTVLNNNLNAFFTSDKELAGVGAEFIFDDQSTGSVQLWEWNFEDDSLTAFAPDDQSHVFGIPGTHTILLTIYDASGCKDTFSLQIVVTDEFDVPNVITTNGDGTNDYFTLPFPIFESFDIIIENRWGNVVHEVRGGTGTLLWNGMNDKTNKKCVDGTYFYLLKGTLVSGTEVSKQGTVSVFNGNGE